MIAINYWEKKTSITGKEWGTSKRWRVTAILLPLLMIMWPKKGHRIKWDHFDILATGQSDIHCKIKETLLIRDLKPALDKMLAAFHCHYFPYSTLNKITQFWLVESSTINPKLYSVGVPIKFSWKRRNFVECTINTKSRDLLVQLVNNRYSWFWKFSNCTRLKGSCNSENFQKELLKSFDFYSRS